MPSRDYAREGVPFVAVKPNDSERYPADSYEAMQVRVRAEQWPRPYLRDESQERGGVLSSPEPGRS